MTLLEEIEHIIKLCHDEVQHGDPLHFAGDMMTMLERWREAVVTQHLEGPKRRREALGVYRILLDDGRLLETQIAKRMLEVTRQFVAMLPTETSS